MRLVLHLSPSSIEFTRKGGNGAHPLLVKVGAVRLFARAGPGQAGGRATENPSLTVTLFNVDREASAIIGSPLRALADVYDDADELIFSGIVANLAFPDNNIDLRLQS